MGSCASKEADVPRVEHDRGGAAAERDVGATNLTSIHGDVDVTLRKPKKKKKKTKTKKAKDNAPAETEVEGPADAEADATPRATSHDARVAAMAAQVRAFSLGDVPVVGESQEVSVPVELPALEKSQRTSDEASVATRSLSDPAAVGTDRSGSRGVSPAPEDSVRSSVSRASAWTLGAEDTPVTTPRSAADRSHSADGLATALPVFFNPLRPIQ